MSARAALLILIMLPAFSGTRPIMERHALLGPDDGPIREVLLTFPPDEFGQSSASQEKAKQRLRGVVDALGLGVNYVVHGYPEHEATIGRVLRDAGAREWKFVPSAFGFYTLWTQDMFLIQKHGRQSIWAVPRKLYRRLDDSVGSEIAMRLNQPVRTLAVPVEGGNLVPFGPLVFAGKDTLLSKDISADDTRRQIVERDIAPGRRWVWVGTKKPMPIRGSWNGIYQPLFHIDLFLTAVGPVGGSKHHVLVGSPRTARKFLRLPPEPDDDDQSYDEIAETLEGQGFLVTRLPLFLDRRSTGMAVISYNNVLLHWGNGHGTVYLPRYGQDNHRLEQLDLYAAGIYQRLGYTVRFVDGPFNELATNFGSLRCMVLVTRRAQ